jgi:hypothetical protein
MAMEILQAVWSGISSLIALFGLGVAIVSLRHSKQVQEQSLSFANLDQKIELAISRSLGLLEAKLESTFVNSKNLQLQLQVFEQKISGMNHRLRRNSVNQSIIQRALLEKGFRFEVRPGDSIDDDEP